MKMSARYIIQTGKSNQRRNAHGRTPGSRDPEMIDLAAFFFPKEFWVLWEWARYCFVVGRLVWRERGGPRRMEISGVKRKGFPIARTFCSSFPLNITSAPPRAGTGS